jgi:short-subunit dehydrogenase
VAEATLHGNGDWPRFIVGLCDHAVSTDEVIEECTAAMAKQCAAGRVKALPGAVELVLEAERHGLIGLATVSPRRYVRAALDALGLAGLCVLAVPRTGMTLPPDVAHLPTAQARNAIDALSLLAMMLTSHLEPAVYGGAVKHYVVTGAGSGIGLAVADRLHARGDTLHLLARSAESAERIAQRFPAAHTFVADLAAPAMLKTALREHKLPEEINGLLHIAGTVHLAAVADLTPDAWQTTLTVNLAAPAELTRLLLPRLRHRAGHVVFVNSTSGLKTQGEWAAYSASKYGLRALADAVRAEENHTGMRVTTVYPGRTATPMQESVHRHERRAYEPERWIAPDTVAAAVIATLDLPADAEVSDITVRVGQGR